MIHVCLYLPTAGKESDFLSDLAKLRIDIDDLSENANDAAVFIKGDGNSSSKNISRSIVFNNFMNDLGLEKFNFNHPTLGLFKGDFLNQIKGQINYLSSVLPCIKGQIKYLDSDSEFSKLKDTSKILVQI